MDKLDLWGTIIIVLVILGAYIVINNQASLQQLAPLPRQAMQPVGAEGEVMCNPGFTPAPIGGQTWCCRDWDAPDNGGIECYDPNFLPFPEDDCDSEGERQDQVLYHASNPAACNDPQCDGPPEPATFIEYQQTCTYSMICQSGQWQIDSHCCHTVNGFCDVTGNELCETCPPLPPYTVFHKEVTYSDPESSGDCNAAINNNHNKLINYQKRNVQFPYTGEPASPWTSYDFISGVVSLTPQLAPTLKERLEQWNQAYNAQLEYYETSSDSIPPPGTVRDECTNYDVV